tara:strand:+ start:899 stop:1189 length:291 start_codon:yes stop_codon:yes gene_type:complete
LIAFGVADHQSATRGQKARQVCVVKQSLCPAGGTLTEGGLIAVRRVGTNEFKHPLRRGQLAESSQGVLHAQIPLAPTSRCTVATQDLGGTRVFLHA